MTDGRLSTDLRLDRLLPSSSAYFPRQVFRSVRMVTRLIEALTVIHSGFPKPLILAAVCCGALDLRIVTFSIRGRPGHLVARLLLDTADVALWSLALHGGADVAAVVATPLVFEIGLWYGWSFVVMPAVVGTATVATLHLAGYRPTPLVFLWPTLWGLAGLLTPLILRTCWRSDMRAARDAIEAAAGQAELSGQNSVAMGADSVVDLLLRTTSLIASYESSPEPSPFSGWKAGLAEVCSSQATYLGVALTRWQGVYNSRSPDLSADVDLRLTPRAGTLLLSPRQTHRLQELLEELMPRGIVPVEVTCQGPMGAAQTILVGTTRLVLTADDAPRPRSRHVAPLAFGMGVILTLVHSVPEWEATPLWVTVPLAILLGLTGWFGLARPGPDPSATAARLVFTGLLLGTADSVLTTALMRPDCTRLPFLFFLQWFGPLLFLYASDLSRLQRIIATTGAVAAASAGALAMPAPFTLISVLMAVPWLLNPIFMVVGLRRLMEADSATLRAEMERIHHNAVEEGFRRGRRLVVQLTNEAVEQLYERHRVVRESLPREVAIEVERRLSEANTLLASIEAD